MTKELRVITSSGDGLEETFRGSLRDVFYYITFVCNLRCRHCYVGDNLASNTHADLDVITTNLAACGRAGAKKVTFLGGEPTLHPDYDRILLVAARQCFERIVVDTNGLGGFPIPVDTDLDGRLAVRLSFDGIDPATHDAIRGTGTFSRTLATLRRVVGSSVRVEATFTVNAQNYQQVENVVSFFAAEGASEVNFHMVSLTGNAKGSARLGLSPEAVLDIQQVLERIRQTSRIPIRFPRLLIRNEALPMAITEGCSCRLFDNSVLLLFPNGRQLRCPLEISRELNHDVAIKQTDGFHGCPLSHKLFPSGIPNGYTMTCISWKHHRPL